jgi:uncharacterized protein (DUF1800 family)
MSKHKAQAIFPPKDIEANLRDVGHLLRRAGFGAPAAQVEHLAQGGLLNAVDSLLNYTQVPDTLAAPDPSILTTGMGARIEPLSEWWLTGMINTSRPLQEKMTLFWHGHFATAFYKVRSSQFMYQQNQLFRQNALGRFDDLLTGVYKDPAMLIWLDGRLNVKSVPNENFGREVMELFTLGVGNYTEDDVHANARAFTGWRLDAKTGAVTFVPRLHDDGSKTLLGQTGNWGADDAVRIMCAHPATGPFLAGKLWKFFASDTPSNAAIQRMADAYYSSDHSIAAMVRTMLTSPEFYSLETRTSWVKNPVDFMVTTARQLGLTQVDVTTWPRLLAVLGQELFNPPNVGGWPGGLNWINGGTMLTRFNIASRLTGDAPGTRSLIDPNAILNAADPQSMGHLIFYLSTTLGIDLSQATERALVEYAGPDSLDRAVDLNTTTLGLIHLMLVSPEYQTA